MRAIDGGGDWRGDDGGSDGRGIDGGWSGVDLVKVGVRWVALGARVGWGGGWELRAAAVIIYVCVCVLVGVRYGGGEWWG